MPAKKIRAAIEATKVWTFKEVNRDTFLPMPSEIENQASEAIEFGIGPVLVSLLQRRRPVFG